MSVRYTFHIQIFLSFPLMWYVEHRLESLYWSVYHLQLDWRCERRHFLHRNHWSLFPVIFVGRRLPLDVYDELMGILMHGCVGESIGPKLEFLRRPTLVT